MGASGFSSSRKRGTVSATSPMRSRALAGSFLRSFLVHGKITRLVQIRMIAVVKGGRHSCAGIKPYHLDFDTSDLGNAPGQITHAQQSAAGSNSEFDDRHLPLPQVTSSPGGFQGRKRIFSRSHQIEGDFGAK